VEDIPPGFDHILMLAGGRMVAKGRLEEVLTSQTLSTAFEMPLEVEQRGQRWRAWSP
jgi:iron complex transport system ATP-binding protein